MAFDAGSVVGHFNLETGGYEGGAQRITGKNASMTKSVLKAQLAFEAIKKAIGFVISVVKGSVTAFTEGERLMAQTAATLKSTGNAAGLVKQEVFNLATAMQNLTTFDDEAVLAAENLMLTFTKVGKDVFPQATQTALDMATALGTDARSAVQQLGMSLQDPILGLTRLRRAGITFTDSQQALVKSLVATGRSAEAQQLILAELDKKFGGSAKAARDTFGGALVALKNHVSDAQEALGQYVAIAGRPFVEELITMAKGVTAFLQSAEGMRQIQAILGPVAGSFAVLFSIGKEVWNLFKNFAGGVIADVKDGFSQIAGKGNEANVAFTILGGVVKVISIGFVILGKAVHFVVQWVVDLVKVARDSYKALEALGDALSHPLDPAKWKVVGETAKQTWESIKTLGVNAFGNVKDMIAATIEEFKTFGTDSKVTGEQLQSVYKSAVDKMNAAFTDFVLKAGETGPAAIVAGNDEGADDVKASWMETFDELVKASNFASETYGSFSVEARSATDAIVEHMLKLAKSGSDAWQVTYAELVGKAREAVQTFGAYSTEAAVAVANLGAYMKTQGEEVEETWIETFRSLKQGIQDAADTFGKGSAQMRSATTKLLEHVQKGVSSTLGAINDIFQQILDIQNASLNAQMTNLDNEYQRRKELIEESVGSEEEKAAQLEALDAEYAAKKAEIQKKQWKAQQAATIAGIIMATAEGVMRALVAVPGPAGWILAALVGALGVAQLAIAASQPMPEFAAKGGTFFPGERVVVGEHGPELLTMGATSVVTPNDQLGGGGIKLAANFYGDINSDVDLDVASMRFARRVQGALRSA